MNKFERIMALRERGVFHRCECLNQDFYEGDELPEAFYNENLAVYTFKGFKFNFWDVCVNPETISHRYKGITYNVHIAEKSEGCFVNGYWIVSDNGEFQTGYLPNFTDNGFKSRNEAIVDVFKKLLGSYKLNDRFCKNMINKYSNIQLSLFDFD